MFSGQRSGVIYYDICRQKAMSLMLIKMGQKNQCDFISSFTTVSKRRYLFMKTHAIYIAALSMTIRVQGLPSSLYKASCLSALSSEMCSPSNSKIISHCSISREAKAQILAPRGSPHMLHVTKLQLNTFVRKI